MLVPSLTSGRARYGAPANASSLRAARVVAAGATLVAAACETSTTATNGRVGSIQLTPAAIALVAGAAQAVDAKVVDASGSIVRQRQSDRRGPSVQQLIAAAAAGLSGTAVVTVHAAPVDAVIVAPSTGTVLVGRTMQLTATTLDELGNIVTGRSVTWSSASTASATVLPTGLVAGVRKGTTTITVR